jgi:hypothetical protein
VVKGLTTTAARWPGIQTASGWGHAVATLLENEDELTGSEVRRRLDALLAQIRDDQATVGALQPAVAHCLKVSASSWPDLFHGYDVTGLPRTNNDLEQSFGSARYHQRRASGRIRATAATVVRGSVRVLAATASQLTLFREYDLWHPNRERWASLRRSLDRRQEARRQQRRFRTNPPAYLTMLVATLLKQSLPS